MKGTFVAIAGLYLVQISLAAIDSNLTAKEGQETIVESPEAILKSQPAQQFIEGIYRRATVQALQSKVSELHMKLMKGENAVPSAMEILKIALLSDPTQQQVKKAAEHVLSIMSPELQKLAPGAVMLDGPTTPMTQK